MSKIIQFGDKEQRRNFRKGQHLAYEQLREKTSDSIGLLIGNLQPGSGVLLPGISISLSENDSSTEEGVLYSVPQSPGKIVIDPKYVNFLADHTDTPQNKVASLLLAQSLGLSWIESVFRNVPNYAKSSVQRKNRRLSAPKFPKFWEQDVYNPNYEMSQNQHVIKNRIAARIALNACEIEDVDVVRFSPPFKIHVASILDPMNNQDIFLAYQNATMISY